MLRAAYRHVRAIVIVVAVVIAVALVTTVTVDLGPALKARAERAGSNWIDRPMHIGRLGIHLASGRFVVEDLVIEGLEPTAPNFLTAKRIEVSLTWGAIFHREILLDTIEMTDWRMVVESRPNGVHNFPRFGGPPRPPSTGPRLVVTTLQYVHAYRGEFVLDDTGSDWGVVAPNLDVTAGKLGSYRGTASFSGGTVRIQHYQPMSADMQMSFRVQDGQVIVEKVDLTTDGARTALTGVVDVPHWPEQTYQITRSDIQLPRMRDIFFHDDDFELSGQAVFTGTFHKYDGGWAVTGDFQSDEMGIDAYRFQHMGGSVAWGPDRLDVTRASSEFYGGRTDFRYRMAPLGVPGERPISRLDVDYTDVDLTRFTNFLETRGLRLAGRATGRNLLEWRLGSWDRRTGEGHVSVAPPPGVSLAGRALPPGAAGVARGRAEIYGPFSNHTPRRPVPIAGAMAYTFDGDAVQIAPSVVATPETYVSFEGRTAWGEDSRMPFHVTSTNWQASDRFLAGLMTAFGATTNAIPVDGVGVFDGVMLGAFRRPRIEGKMLADAMRAWGVTWGAVDGDVVVDNSYASVSNTVIRDGRSEMRVDGQFSLGYPRSDGGEEIDARVRVNGRPVRDFLEAFDLEDYPVEGEVSGDFHLYGAYTEPLGYGRLTIDRGIAYDEPFATASAALRFEGNGVRLDGMEIEKGGGTVTGAAFVGWNGNYSFNADGRRLAVETLELTAVEGMPRLNGLVDFSAAGSGTFDQPRYDVKVSVRDLFFGTEGIGQVTGRLSVRDELLNFEVEAASPRLAVSGTGRIAITDEGDTEMSFRVTDTSLDPYVRALDPSLSAFTTAVASGTIRVVGELYNPDALRVDTTVEQVDLRFFDYHLRNAGPIRLGVDRQVLRVDAMRLVGDDTELDLTGTVNLPDTVMSLRAGGAANLAVLQGFLPDLRSSGRAEVSAAIEGPVSQPVVSGNALVSNGRLRHFSFPHALESLNGIVTFNAAGLRLDGLTGRLGGGAVQFGGRVGITGYRLGEFDVRASAEGMRLRFPEGMRSVVDADLALQGPADGPGPVLSGTVTVQSATWSGSVGSTGSMFGLGAAEQGVPAPEGAIGAVPTLPVRYDVRVLAPSSLRIDSDQARIVASADLNLRGTFDRPLLFGRADIERGEVEFEGRRYVVLRGSLDFTNPNRIQPFFDVEAETRVRVPGQTYRVTLRMTGTTERLQPEFTSDPPLAPVDILTLLFSDTAPSGDAEVAQLRTPNQAEQDLLQARATRALTGALSDEVGKVVEQTFGVDTFQITPLLVDPYQQSSRLNVNPAARVTIGKRISDRIYLTYARSLSSSTRDEIILLEYDQSDSLAWVLSQNEDRTYALEVRKRIVF
ncbi:MAG: translocation/assembly module TamB domain-containing protein [Vicinamibacterales bacterium]